MLIINRKLKCNNRHFFNKIAKQSLFREGLFDTLVGTKVGNLHNTFQGILRSVCLKNTCGYYTESDTMTL